MELLSLACKCGNEWRQYSIEWPPRLAICSKCHVVLKLEAYDPKSGKVSFTRNEKL